MGKPQSDKESEIKSLSNAKTSSFLRKPFQCEVCFENFASRSQLKLHTSKVHEMKESESMTRCEICNGIFSNLQVHMLANHQAENLQDFKNDESKKNNVSIYSSTPKNYQDTKINTSGVSKLPIFPKNITKNASITPIVPNLTHKLAKNEEFQHKMEFEAHLNALQGEKISLKCEICDVSFKVKQDLNIHVETVHKKKEQNSKGKCNICHGIFSPLEVHIQMVHGGKKQFQCYICDFGCNDKTTLESHITNIHKEKSPFECNICKKGFSRKANFITHLSVYHEKEQKSNSVDPQNNSILEKVTKAKENYQDGKNSFLCHPCKKGFVKMKELTDHILAVHKGLKQNIDKSTDNSELIKRKNDNFDKNKHHESLVPIIVDEDNDQSGQCE